MTYTHRFDTTIPGDLYGGEEKTVEVTALYDFSWVTHSLVCVEDKDGNELELSKGESDKIHEEIAEHTSKARSCWQSEQDDRRYHEMRDQQLEDTLTQR